LHANFNQFWAELQFVNGAVVIKFLAADIIVGLWLVLAIIDLGLTLFVHLVSGNPEWVHRESHHYCMLA